LRRAKNPGLDLLFVFKTAPILPARLSRRAFLLADSPLETTI